MGTLILIEVYILVLGYFVGLEILGKVPPVLHAPLISGATTINGVVLFAALAFAKPAQGMLAQGLGAVAIALGTASIVGGYLVTQRMLASFEKKS